MDNPAGSFTIDTLFRRFIEQELLPLIDMDAARFWNGVATIFEELTPLNRQLLARRRELQAQIDGWHRERKATGWTHDEYLAFLRDIDYLVPRGEPFQISTEGVDAEIASVAGPQLVVPVNNSRFAINAANARWVSLFDSLYGSDVIPSDCGKQAGGSYNPVRGQAVIEYAVSFLDRVVPLAGHSHGEVSRYTSEANGLTAHLGVGDSAGLVDPGQFRGWSGGNGTASFLLLNNGLHIEIVTDPEHPVGKEAPAHISDIVLESAITTIQDCEDSVAAVDAQDKVGVYRNWLALVRGTLEAKFEKNGRMQTRRMNQDRNFLDREGQPFTLPGTSLLLVRNVGHLMTTDALLDVAGNEVFEGMLDAIVTVGCALARRVQPGMSPNSRHGSIYIVKPKMHGPQEAAFANTLFDRVEDLYGLPRHSVKIGVMDEERRTTVNLAECIRAAQHRLVFINTGFLDRTGDEIFTSMEAGPVLPKGAIKHAPWIRAYENWNVDTGIACGLPGKAQIGKGMWAMPDEMKSMMESKQAHLEAGASCAWVPSPTAACLHAMHYHETDVFSVQRDLANREPASLDDILTPPLMDDPSRLTKAEIQQELDNNTQGILGYVVRWIDHGIGCSKVPDINDTGQMEDRATLRISSQHIVNWLHHDVCNAGQVLETLQRMAVVVDGQNSGDPAYRRMSDDFDGSIAFNAACDLVFKGREQPNGYSEPLLHAYRKTLKSRF